MTKDQQTDSVDINQSELENNGSEENNAEISKDQGKNTETTDPQGGDSQSIDTAATRKNSDQETVGNRPRYNQSSIRRDNALVDRGEKQDHETDISSPNPETYAAIHQLLGDAGVHLNKAHGHLSSLQSVGHVESKADQEISRAEVEALVEILVETQEHLIRALNQASETANELNVEVSVEESFAQLVDEEMAEMSWNTTNR